MGQQFNTAGWDVVFLGGGLASGLFAYRLKILYPEMNILVIEQDKHLGGNHTWSFHSGDLTQDEFSWIQPFVSKSWQNYTVFFPDLTRTIVSGYHSIRSEQFHNVLTERLKGSILLGCRVKSCTDTSVTLIDGRIFSSKLVLDGRGFEEIQPEKVGYQKFVGLDITLTEPHGLTNPVLMDVRVEQKDGFRFIYLLPWSETSILIEDTRYSSDGQVQVSEYITEIRNYAANRGWTIASIDRQEVGSLPIPLVESFTQRKEVQQDQPAPIGVRTGVFHPTTGYSLPDTVRLSEIFASLPEKNSESWKTALKNYLEKNKIQFSYLRLLNRMLFLAAEPEKRFSVLQRFYRLSEGLIHRFYGGRLNWADYLRILVGKPPVPVLNAMRCIFENGGIRQLEKCRHEVKISSR